jgi:hypothetical protein
MLPMFENENTETIIRKVLGLTYREYGFEIDTPTVKKVGGILAKPVPAEASDSEAADEVREVLWDRHLTSWASAKATCDLFYALGRENELGWIIGEANYTHYDYEYFIGQLRKGA